MGSETRTAYLSAMGKCGRSRAIHHASRNAAVSVAAALLGLSCPVVLRAQDAAPAATPAPSPQEMIDEIKALKGRINQLETQQAASQAKQQEYEAKLNKTNGHDVGVIVADILKDAEQRSQLAGEATAGYRNKRFFIGSADGNFLFQPWLHLQVRQSTNWRDDSRAGSKDDTENGFEIRRARFGFDGNIGSPDLTYLFNWATYRNSQTTTITDSSGKNITVDQGNGGLPVLEEAWGKYHFAGTPWSVRFGQMHDPLSHETIIGSKYRDPEASLQGDIFGNTDTFVQGATVIYDPGNDFRFEGGITDGIRSANTDFRDWSNSTAKYDWGLAGRAEYKFMGNWKDYNQLTALGNKSDLLIGGLGVDYSEGGERAELNHTADLQYALTNGWSFYGAYWGRYTRHNMGIPSGAPVSTSFGSSPGDLGRDTYEPSVFVQAAYLIDQHWEPYVRYEYLKLAGTPDGSNNNVHEISGGVHYYLFGHNAKFTAQLMYLPNGIPIDDTSSDVLKSNDRAELIFMAQFQLLI